MNEKELMKKINKSTQDHMHDPTNRQCNKISKLFRERLSIFIPKDTFNHNEEYMYIMIKELVWMTSEFIAENKISDNKSATKK